MKESVKHSGGVSVFALAAIAGAVLGRPVAQFFGGDEVVVRIALAIVFCGGTMYWGVSPSRIRRQLTEYSRMRTPLRGGKAHQLLSNRQYQALVEQALEFYVQRSFANRLLSPKSLLGIFGSDQTSFEEFGKALGATVSACSALPMFFSGIAMLWLTFKYPNTTEFVISTGASIFFSALLLNVLVRISSFAASKRVKLWKSWVTDELIDNAHFNRMVSILHAWRSTSRGEIYAAGDHIVLPIDNDQSFIRRRQPFLTYQVHARHAQILSGSRSLTHISLETDDITPRMSCNLSVITSHEATPLAIGQLNAIDGERVFDQTIRQKRNVVVSIGFYSGGVIAAGNVEFRLA